MLFLLNEMSVQMAQKCEESSYFRVRRDLMINLNSIVYQKGS